MFWRNLQIRSPSSVLPFWKKKKIKLTVTFWKRKKKKANCNLKCILKEGFEDTKRGNQNSLIEEGQKHNDQKKKMEKQNIEQYVSH